MPVSSSSNLFFPLILTLSVIALLYSLLLLSFAGLCPVMSSYLFLSDLISSRSFLGRISLLSEGETVLGVSMKLLVTVFDLILSSILVLGCLLDLLLCFFMD